MNIRSTVYSVLLGALIIVGTSGCSGDPDTLLTDGVWTFEDLSSTSEDENTQSFIALAKALMTDATMEFQDNGTYIMESPLSDNPETGTWELVGDDQLIMDPDGSGLASTANIDVLTRKQLTYIETFNDVNMNTYTTTTVWVRD